MTTGGDRQNTYWQIVKYPRVLSGVTPKRLFRLSCLSPGSLRILVDLSFFLASCFVAFAKEVLFVYSYCHGRIATKLLACFFLRRLLHEHSKGTKVGKHFLYTFFRIRHGRLCNFCLSFLWMTCTGLRGCLLSQAEARSLNEPNSKSGDSAVLLIITHTIC